MVRVQRRRGQVTCQLCLLASLLAGCLCGLLPSFVSGCSKLFRTPTASRTRQLPQRWLPAVSAAWQFLAPVDSDNIRIKFIQESVQPAKRGLPVTAVIGPSRQGKSQFCNILIGQDNEFEVSQNPINPSTAGAWISISRDGSPLGNHVVVDTEGLSLNVYPTTLKTFFAIYPISTNMVFSTKDPLNEMFFEKLANLHANRGDYKDADQERKPRGILLLRDADSYDFVKNDEGSYVLQDGKTFEMAVQEKLIDNRAVIDDLFSSFHAFAIPNLKNEAAEDALLAGDMPLLLDMLNSNHPGQLVSLTDYAVIENLVTNMNEGTFDVTVLLMRLLSEFTAASFEHAQEGLAQKYKWNHEDLLIDFYQKLDSITSSFPNVKSNPIIDALEKDVLAIAYRMKNKTKQAIKWTKSADGKTCLGALVGLGAVGVLNVASGGLALVINGATIAVLESEAAFIAAKTAGMAIGAATGYELGKRKEGQYSFGKEPNPEELEQWMKTCREM